MSLHLCQDSPGEAAHEEGHPNIAGHLVIGVLGNLVGQRKGLIHSLSEDFS